MIKQPVEGPKVTRPYWRIMVNECTQLKFTSFFEKKDGMIEPTCLQLDKWQQNGMPVGSIRLDGAEESKILQKRAETAAWKLNINFEYTAANTPQQNHLAELGFAFLANRGRAMMYHANLPLETRYQLL
jgi:hypothetical protein